MERLRKKVTDIVWDVLDAWFEYMSTKNKYRAAKVIIHLVYTFRSKETIMSNDLPETKKEAMIKLKESYKEYVAENSKLSKILE